MMVREVKCDSPRFYGPFMNTSTSQSQLSEEGSPAAESQSTEGGLHTQVDPKLGSSCSNLSTRLASLAPSPDFSPSLTKAQHKLRLLEDRELDSKYPGCYVAYTDTWTNDVLTRTILVAATDPSEFHRKIADLGSDVRDKLLLTLTPEADESILSPSTALE